MDAIIYTEQACQITPTPNKYLMFVIDRAEVYSDVKLYNKTDRCITAIYTNVSSAE